MAKNLLVYLCLVFALLIMAVPLPARGADLRRASAEPQAGTYVVTDSSSDADINPGDGFCLTAAARCTLRAAIQEANLDGTASLIQFAAPMNITYPALPAITEGVTTIDASSQWQGTWPNGEPGVSIGGGDPVLTIQSDGNAVYGMLFGGGGTMIRIEGDAGLNTIGGAEAGQRNVFLGDTGVEIQSSDFGNAIVSNYFGTKDGVIPLLGGQWGVVVWTSGNRIEDNLIGMQATAGVSIYGDDNFVQGGNIIGLDKLRQPALPNGVGVLIYSGNNNVIWRNDIGSNTSHGVELHHGDYNSVVENIMDGNDGDGIHVFDANHNLFGGEHSGNTIRNSGGAGVWLFGHDNTVQSNYISGSGQDGIYVDRSQNNQIGGATAGMGNILRENGGDGIYLSGTAISTTIQGNDIGLADRAFDAGNDGHGIYLDDGASQNHIGGLGAGEGNWIAWNGLSGIYLTGTSTQDNVVDGNVIGAPVNWGWPAPNGNHGISLYDGAHDNWIGWSNIIASSSWSGVAIVNSDDNVVWLNYIGTNQDGGEFGNSYYGVVVVNGTGNRIFGNEIGFNGGSSGQAGVRIDGGLAGNPINANSIHDNVGAGIELVNGGNFGLGAPTLTQATCQAQLGEQAQVQGMSCQGCTVEIFSDAADEGHFYEGTTTADANSGAFTWNGVLHGPHVTSTATTPAGATSAFSAPLDTGPCALPSVFLPLMAK
jgi:parallel beta-helix repeat protein